MAPTLTFLVVGLALVGSSYSLKCFEQKPKSSEISKIDCPSNIADPVCGKSISEFQAANIRLCASKATFADHEVEVGADKCKAVTLLEAMALADDLGIEYDAGRSANNDEKKGVVCVCDTDYCNNDSFGSGLDNSKKKDSGTKPNGTKSTGTKSKSSSPRELHSVPGFVLGIALFLSISHLPMPPL